MDGHCHGLRSKGAWVGRGSGDYGRRGLMPKASSSVIPLFMFISGYSFYHNDDSIYLNFIE